MKNGHQLPIPLQHNLRDIMWEYCGVVKNNQSLYEGLHKIGLLR